MGPIQHVRGEQVDIAAAIRGGRRRCRTGPRYATANIGRMYEGDQVWAAVDDYFITRLVHEDDALAHARMSSSETVMPMGDVAPNQGAFLSIIAQLAGARRVLEFGTLAGYSTIWLARAVGPAGKVVTFEIDEARRQSRG